MGNAPPKASGCTGRRTALSGSFLHRKSADMAFLYVSLLAAVAFVLLIELAGNVRRVSRPLDRWVDRPFGFARPEVERRTQALPFVGQERRRAAVDEAAKQPTTRVVEAQAVRQAA